MKIYTIGFTKKSAREFFGKLRQPGLVRLIDTRLNNVSQLAGFTKRDDLEFFSKEIGGVDYAHAPDLAPTQDILDEYKKNGGDWSTYEHKFLELMARRAVEKKYTQSQLDGACLLCSEPTPHHCHRRLVAEYFKKFWPDIEICHL